MEAKNMNYEDRMLYAFVGKPEKFLWYKKAFLKYNHSGVSDFAWNWSWYAFFFGFWYLLYRKEYFWSLILILIYALLGSTGGFYALLINSVIGGSLPYFVYLRYIRKKQEIESKIQDEELRVEVMEKIGGTNKFVIGLGIACIVLTLLIIFIVLGGSIMMANM